MPAPAIEKGITMAKSLQYAFIVAFAAPLLAASFADKFERKWIICGACLAIIVFAIAFSQLAVPVLLIACGVLPTAANRPCPMPTTPIRAKRSRPPCAHGRRA